MCAKTSEFMIFFINFADCILCGVTMELIISTILGCFAIGVILSAPMGPIGILCIQRTLNKGREAGWWTGLGAAISDLLYCLLTGMGMSFVNKVIESNQAPIQIFGSVILLVFGVFLVKRNPATEIKDTADKKGNHYQEMGTGFLLTLSNPLIVFLIIPLFARFGFPSADMPWPLILIGYGVILAGALVWWTVITFLVNAVRSHFNIRSMWVINIVIGVIILILSIYGLITGVMYYIG